MAAWGGLGCVYVRVFANVYILSQIYTYIYIYENIYKTFMPMYIYTCSYVAFYVYVYYKYRAINIASCKKYIAQFAEYSFTNNLLGAGVFKKPPEQDN